MFHLLLTILVCPLISVLASLKGLVLRVGLSIRDATSKRNATWLILPVVICLSQRLSHTCGGANDASLYDDDDHDIYDSYDIPGLTKEQLTFCDVMDIRIRAFKCNDTLCNVWDSHIQICEQLRADLEAPAQENMMDSKLYRTLNLKANNMIGQWALNLRVQVYRPVSIHSGSRMKKKQGNGERIGPQTQNIIPLIRLPVLNTGPVNSDDVNPVDLRNSFEALKENDN
ncbi:hypothetical protein Tco_1149615 [Tanacetum coccineum]